jgi:hypothetical protein
VKLIRLDKDHLFLSYVKFRRNKKGHENEMRTTRNVEGEKCGEE